MVDPALVAAVTAIVVGVGLMVAHRRSYRAIDASARPDDREFAQNQYRRRMQNSAMIALVGLLLFVGRWVVAERTSPLFVLLYWLFVVAVVVWIVLLALADVLATRSHFAKITRDELAEQIRLHAELRRVERERDAAQRPESNGREDRADD